MAKKTKIILLAAAAFLFLVGLALVYSFWDSERILPGVKIPSRLNDPGLVYASKFWGGLCSNGKGEQGGCYFETYLYDTGKVLQESGFTSYENKTEVNPTVEKNLGTTLVNQIAKKIKDSGIMAKYCPPTLIEDAGWYYQITIDGVKKEFRDVPKDCQDIFDETDKILDDAIEKAAPIAGDFLINNLKNIKFIYTEDNGSLPPQYYQKNVLTLSEFSLGSITGELVNYSYENSILKRKDVAISVDQFKKIIKDTVLIGQANKNLEGCTGGNNQSVEILREENVIFSASNYNCGGESTNEKLLDFSRGLDSLLK